MKKFLLSLMLAGAALTANAQYQVRNGDMEAWEDVTGTNGTKGVEPQYFSSFLTCTTTFDTFVMNDQVQKSTDTRPGSSGQYSAYIFAKSVAGGLAKAQGNLTTGRIAGNSMSATDANGNYNFTDVNDAAFNHPFTGRPDYMKVWVKYNGANSSHPYGNVHAVLHADGYYQDPVGNTSKMVARVGHAKKSDFKTTNGWVELTIPFTYDSNDTPAYLLLSFSTNADPGDGDTKDYMYIDDIEMVYISELVDPTYNGNAITFTNGSANIDAPYNAKLLKYTTGIGANVKVTEPTADNNFTMTIAIEGNDISVNPSNAHTYTIKFTGLAGGNDDESSVNIIIPTLELQSLADGRYYIKSVAVGAYLNDDNTLVDVPQKAWNVSGTSKTGTIQDTDGHYLVLDRLKSATSFNSANFSITSNATSIDNGMDYTYVAGNGYFEFYRKDLRFNTSGVSTSYKRANTYVGATSKTSFVAYNGSNGDYTKWQLIAPADYIVYYFCSNATSASLSSPLSYDISVLDNVTKTSLVGMPLGIYSIDGGEKFYLENGTELDVTSSNKTLTYYGRLNFGLDAKFNGATLTPSALCDEPYDEALLTLTANGNGVQKIEKFFDETTNELTVTVSGYGRQNEYIFKFAAPDLSLNATWYGEAVEDGAVIREAYNASKFVVTPGKGASCNVFYNESTGVATITLSCASDSKEYKVNFAVTPATVDSNAFSPIKASNNGVTADASGMVFTVATLENDNISFTFSGIAGVGSITASNIAVDKKGNFHYSGQLRGTESETLAYTAIYGQYKDGQLVASADVKTSATNLMHATYGIQTTGQTATFTDDLVVTINGNANTAPDKTITMGSQTNGNISFSLTDFQMQLGGIDTYVGNIFLENLPIDAAGNFTFDGDILIGNGTDSSKDWMGLGLNLVPVKMRGQKYSYNGEEQLIVVIDIDMQDQIGQTIHVTFGAESVGDDKTYNDDLEVTINGTKTAVPDTKIVVGELKNGNINFSLKDFQMELDGKPAYVGNVAIDNIAVDEKGNFTYEGSIRIGDGDMTLPGDATWMGPTLGDVPVVIRGSVCDFNGGNSTDEESQCIVVIDIDMQQQIGQRIHVTYGLETEGESYYEDDLYVTINGVTTSEPEVEIEVDQLRNGNIMFLLDNFAMNIDGHKQPVGNICIENLQVDENGRFSYEGVIRIGKGSDSSVSDQEWMGPGLEDVPLVLEGQVYTVGSEEFLLVNIDIDMEKSLGQTINVTFGATPESSKNYTDDIKVTVNGEGSTDQATITVGTLKNGYINFALPNFHMNLGGIETYIGNIAINALALDEEGKFAYNGNVRIGAGDMELPDNTTWLGPTLGAIPLQMTGQLYTVGTEEYLLVKIAIDMQDEIGQTIDVLFGGTPVRTVALNDNLSVTVNADENHQTADVNVGILRNGDINFTLRNFILEMNDEGVAKAMPVGNLSIDALDIDKDGSFSYTGTIRIGKGDDVNVDIWSGPSLGDIPVVLNGCFSEANEKAYVTIDIDMMDQIGQTINVVFGTEFDATIGDLVKLIEKVKAGKTEKSNIAPYVDRLLGK